MGSDVLGLEFKAPVERPVLEHLSLYQYIKKCQTNMTFKGEFGQEKARRFEAARQVWRP